MKQQMTIRVAAFLGATLLLAALSLHAQAPQNDRVVINTRDTVDIRPVSNTQGYDFTSYLRGIADRIQSRWRSTQPERQSAGRIVISVDLNRSGFLIRRVTRGMGFGVDQAAMDVVRSLNSFASLPTEFPGDRLSVELEFSLMP